MSRVAAALSLLALHAPARVQEPAPAAPDWNGDSFSLFEGLHRSRRIHLQVPSGPCERAAERLAAALRAAGEFEVTLSPEECPPTAVRVLVGAPSDPELEPLARQAGLEPIENGFLAFEREYREPGDAAVAVFQDPERLGQPLCLVLGNDKELVARYLTEIPRLSRPHLWIHAAGELAVECALGPGGRARPGAARDYLARREQYFAGGLRMELDSLVVQARAEPDPERWRAYRAALTMARRRVLAWFEAEEAPTVEILLYEHLEDFEHALGTSALALANRLRPRVHVLLAEGLPDDAGQGLARVLARELAGQPVQPWLEDGLALAAAGRWWGRPLDEWIGHLGLGNFLPTPAELQGDGLAQRTSEHVLMPARALLFRVAAQAASREPGQVRALWKGADLGGNRLLVQYQKAALEAAQGKGGEESAEPGGDGAGSSARPRRPGALKRLRAAQAGGAAVPAPSAGAPGPRAAGGGRRAGGARGGAAAARAAELRARAERLAAAPVRHGLALVQDATGGYSARAVAAALTEAGELGLGPNALSLTVFATAEDPLPAACTLLPRAVHGSASDAALANACALAREGELRVLLALEVLSGPNGAWADNISWTGVDDTPEFFERYTRIALHYALLSELLGVEILSLGANLREASRTDPRGPVREPKLFEQRRAGWKGLIGRLRSAFRGGLTYAAYFPVEGHESGFIEELDFLGVSLYPHLAQDQRVPSDDDLRRGLRYQLQQALDLAVRWNKPLLIVQLGFPARAESWTNPSLPRGAHERGPQLRFYGALADVLAGKLENAATLRGVFLWNWPLSAPPAGADFGLRAPELEPALERLFAR